MHVKLSRTYPVPRHTGFAYFMDVGSWKEWTTLDVTDAEAAVWERSGDRIQHTRKSGLPGPPLPGTAVLDEVTPDELMRMRLTTMGLPTIPIEARFAHCGPSAFTLSLTVHTEDPVGFFGDALERLFFIETLIARDMRSCLDGLEHVLAKSPVA